MPLPLFLNSRLGKAHGGVESGDITIYMSIGTEYIQIAIVIIVEEIGTEGETGEGFLSKSYLESNISEKAVAFITVEGNALQLEIGDEDIQISIVVVVSEVASHPCFHLAVFIMSYAGPKFYFGESAASVVLIEEFLGPVVGHKDIYITIIVVVTANYCQTFSLGGINASLLSYITVGTIAVVPVKAVGFASELTWCTIHSDSFFFHPTYFLL